jgi:hypothetical protein
MKILIRDIMQESDAPAKLISPALSDRYTTSNIIDLIDLAADNDGIDCIGIGYTDATEVKVILYKDSDFLENTITITRTAPYQNGLYLLTTPYTPTGDSEYDFDTIRIEHNGTYIGRVGLGKYRELGTAVSKELGFFTTSESRRTLSGQIIPGAGGYSGRSIDLDVRYKIDSDVYADIERAYNYIMRSYPYFLLLDCEQHKVPVNMERFYACTNEPISKLQSSTYKFLYSYRFEFQECF